MPFHPLPLQLQSDLVLGNKNFFHSKRVWRSRSNEKRKLHPSPSKVSISQVDSRAFRIRKNGITALPLLPIPLELTPALASRYHFQDTLAKIDRLRLALVISRSLLTLVYPMLISSITLQHMTASNRSRIAPRHIVSRRIFHIYHLRLLPSLPPLQSYTREIIIITQTERFFNAKPTAIFTI